MGVEGSLAVASVRSDHIAPTTIADLDSSERNASDHTLAHAVSQLAKAIDEALKTGDLRRALDLVARLRALAA